MGTADLVPGVSGGTVALITGIYPRLLGAVTSVDAAAIRLLLQGQWSGLWRHVDGAFLLPLMLGIASAIFGLAGTLKVLLETQPLFVWSFFCGLVLVSSLSLIRTEITRLTPTIVTMALLGVVAMLVLGLGPGVSFPQHSAGFFVAGLFGICAMILPGISGSFILLLLGMYGTNYYCCCRSRGRSVADFCGGLWCWIAKFQSISEFRFVPSAFRHACAAGGVFTRVFSDFMAMAGGAADDY
jgi:putative membrane protein